MLLRPPPRGPCQGLALLALLWLLAPAGAWYKHVASPRYHTVGRASGLLMGVRRSPYLWRRQADEGAPPGPRWLRLLLRLEGARRSALGQPPDLASPGAPRERAAPGPPSRRGGGQSAGPRQGPAWAALCPPACQGEPPWRERPAAAGSLPELHLPRATRKKGQPASIFEPEI